MDGRFLPAAELLAVAELNILAQPQPLRHLVQALLAHERRADARQVALGQIRVAVEQIVRRHHAEHGVAQKLQPLVAAEAAAVLVGVGAVVERALEQFLVFKRVIQPFFQRMHFFSYAPLSNS